LTRDQAQRDSVLRRRLRSLRRHCWKLLVWFVIGSAVLVSIGRLLAPQADLLRPVVETYLSRALDQPVRIGSVEASWPRWSPRVWLNQLEVGPVGTPLLAIQRAQLELRLYNLVRPAHNTLNLAILGLNLVLSQNADGGWTWSMVRGGQFERGWERTLVASDLELRDSRIQIAPRGVPALDWSAPRARLDRKGEQLRVRFDAFPAGEEAESLAVRLQLDMPDSRLRSIRGYAESPNFALAQLAFDETRRDLDNLRAQMKWWLDWRAGEPARFHARVDLHSLENQGIAGRISSHLELDGRWSKEELAVELNARDFNADSEPIIAGLAFGIRDAKMALAADRVDLHYLHELLDPWLAYFRFWPEQLAGKAGDVRLAARPGGLFYRAAGQIQGLRLQVGQFQVAGLDMMLELEGDQLFIRPSGAPELRLGGVFREPIGYHSVSGRIGLRPAWIALENFRLEHPEMELEADGRVHWRPEPFFDLAVNIPRLEPEQPRRWLPLRGLPSKTRSWLNDALLQLESLQAMTVLFGNPTAWHKRIAPGGLESRIVFTGLDLAYARNWPEANDLSGRLTFLSDSMVGRVEHGSVASLPLRAPRVRIRDLRRAEVELDLRTVDGQAAGLAALVRSMPLQAARPALEQLRFSGDAAARARLWLPVRHREDWRLAGRVDFDRASVVLIEQQIELDQLTGALPFTHQRLGPARLDTVVRSEAVALDFDAMFRPKLDLRIVGELPLTGVVPGSWLERWPAVFERIHGRADFDFQIASRELEGESRPTLTVTSDLAGIRSTLPAPLAKPGAQAWASRVEIPLGGEPMPVMFSLDQRFYGKVLADGEYWQLALGLGADKAGLDLPLAENFVVEGRLEQLAPVQWLALIGENPGATLDPDAQRRALSGWLDVTIDELRIGDSSLDTVDFQLVRADQYWRLTVEGERMAGDLRIPATGSAEPVLVFDLARLHWPAAEASPAGAPPRTPGPPSKFDPREMPDVDVAIGSLHWGALDLGQFRLDSHRAEQGLRIEQVSSRRDGFELVGSGVWGAAQPGPDSSMRLRLNSDNFGRDLKNAGFDLGLENGRARIELDGRWPGTPLDFALQRVDGTLDLQINNGSIPEAGPGAGRLLGLVSLGSIPRRLRLDFSDVFGEGLAFDRIKGKFQLDAPIATTDGLEIDAPSAQITIEGQTDLAARTYDQVLIVKPGVSATLPIIGLLAGGPIGAAAGAALDQLLSRASGGISEIRYSVTGSWSNPEIQPLNARPARGETASEGS